MTKQAIINTMINALGLAKEENKISTSKNPKNKAEKVQ